MCEVADSTRVRVFEMEREDGEGGDLVIIMALLGWYTADRNLHLLALRPCSSESPLTSHPLELILTTLCLFLLSL